MDMLVLGANDADLEAVISRVEDAGHRVHRCAPVGMPERSAGTCVGRLEPASCPLTQPIDVALLIDTGTVVDGLEPSGLGCAVRDHVPVACMLPGDDPVAAATAALRARDRAWSEKLAATTGDPVVDCQTTRNGNVLRVRVSATIPGDDIRAIGKLGNRAFEVLRDELPTAITATRIDVSVPELV